MKKYILRFWPAIFIATVWFIFTSPYFLSDKVPFPATYQVNNFAPWSTVNQFWGPVKNGAMPDIITQIYPWRHLGIEIWKTGQVPLWNPYTFSGNPLLANYQSATLSPFNLLFLIIPFVDAWSLLVLIQPLMAGSFMYIFVRSLNRTRVASIISSVSFMFCGFITVWMGYATLAFAILFLPLALSCIEKYYQIKKWKFLLLLSFSIPLSFFSGHFQISLYFLILTGIYIAYKLLVTRKVSTTFHLVFAVIFGLMISMPQLLPSMEFYLQSLRSNLFQKNEVIPWGYLSTFLAPDFLGNPVTRNDWFGHYAEWNSYVGVLPLMLAIYSVLGKKRVQTLSLFITSIVVLLLVFPTPLQDAFVSLHIPVLSTSAASRMIVLYSFLFSVLSAFGFDQLVLDIKDKKIWKIVLWMLGFAVIFFVYWGIVYLKLFIPVDRITISRNNLIFPTLLFAASAFAIIIATLNKKILVFSIYLLLLIVSFDMLRFAIKWMPFDPKNLVFPDTATTNAFSKIAGYNRVFGNLGGEASMYYHLPSVEGYDALYSKEYGQFINYIEKNEIIKSAWSVVSFPKNSLNTAKAINLLDIKYIVHKIGDTGTSWTFPVWAYPQGQFTLIYKDDKYEFYENNNAFPHAFLVGKYRVIENQEEVLKTLFSKNFDLKQEIVLGENPTLNIEKVVVGEARIINYKPNSVEISVDSKNNALLFLADNYLNGWKASIDGKNVSILRADYSFRAVEISKGKHNVKFWYDPWSFRLGVYLAIGGLIGILIMILLSRSTNPSRSFSFLRSGKDR